MLRDADILPFLLKLQNLSIIAESLNQVLTWDFTGRLKAA